VTPTKQTKKYFRPGWNEDFNNSRQSNASGLDGMKTSTIADKAMLHSWMEQRLQQWQTKQCFSPGWNEDFNNSRHKKPAEKSTVQAYNSR
jgi:hypothetical protein